MTKLSLNEPARKELHTGDSKAGPQSNCPVTASLIKKCGPPRNPYCALSRSVTLRHELNNTSSPFWICRHQTASAVPSVVVPRSGFAPQPSSVGPPCAPLLKYRQPSINLKISLNFNSFSGLKH